MFEKIGATTVQTRELIMVGYRPHTDAVHEAPGGDRDVLGDVPDERRGRDVRGRRRACEHNDIVITEKT